MPADRITLDELVAIAKRVQELHISPDCDAARMANGIVDLLGEAQPCGWNPPRVGAGVIDIGATFEVGRITTDPNDLRALCGMWLRAADEAEVSRG